MTLTDEDLTEILRAIREGYSATIGGSRCHTDYYFRDGAFRDNVFDEGFTQEAVIDEATMRRVVSDNPMTFIGALDRHRWRACKSAVLAGDWPTIVRALDGLRAPDAFRHAELLRATGAWPHEAPSDELREHIARCERSRTLYHAFMTAVGWEKSTNVSERAFDWIARVEAMIGAPCENTRASFTSDAARCSGPR